MKTSLYILFLILLFCKMFQFPVDGTDWHWLIVTLPIWGYMVLSILSFLFYLLYAKRKSTKFNKEVDTRWKQKLEEIRKVQPPKPMKFNK